MAADSSARMNTGAGYTDTVDADVLGSTEVDEGALRRLLRRAGRTLARPALECLELLLDARTPPQVRLTMLAVTMPLFEQCLFEFPNSKLTLNSHPTVPNFLLE